MGVGIAESNALTRTNPRGKALLVIVERTMHVHLLLQHEPRVLHPVLQRLTAIFGQLNEHSPHDDSRLVVLSAEVLVVQANDSADEPLHLFSAGVCREKLGGAEDRALLGGLPLVELPEDLLERTSASTSRSQRRTSSKTSASSDCTDAIPASMCDGSAFGCPV